MPFREKGYQILPLCSIMKTFLRIIGTISFFTLPTVFFNWHGLFYQDVQWLADANGFYHISIRNGSHSCGGSRLQ